MSEQSASDYPEGVEVCEPAMLIRINRLFEPGLSTEDLYDTTRGVWRVAARREGARFALAVFGGTVLEVYEIESWHPAGTTTYSSGREIDLNRYADRWEFTGRVAPEPVRSRYVGRSVASYFEQGNANPVLYVNC